MKNIFSQTKDYVKPPKRNVFDLSFHNHGTYNFGILYPVFCKEVIPGDSFKIDSSFALRFMPTAFPVQTRINANLHFFYVRNRNLWDDWQKFITHTGQTGVFPYLDVINNSVTTGSLSDYLGVPSTFVGDYGNSQFFGNTYLLGDVSGVYYSYAPVDGVGFTNADFGISASQLLVAGGNGNLRGYYLNYDLSVLPSYFSLGYNNSITNIPYSNVYLYVFGKNSLGDYVLLARTTEPLSSVPGNGNSRIYNVPLKYWEFNGDNAETSYDTIGKLRDKVTSVCGDSIRFALIQEGDSTGSFLLNSRVPSSGGYTSLNGVTIDVPSNTEFKDLTDVPLSDNPFISSNLNSIKLSALPYRAYESIYNAFYRNEQNDPLFIDGIPEYNKYVPNTEGGLDSFNYGLHQRNWELDFLTSAVQSPQQGIAPLVGVSSSGDFTFVNKDSNGNVGYFTAKANIGSDGSSITGFQLSDKVVLDGVPSDPYSASDVPDNIKRGTVYSLNQMALAGISINDFRNVNALQRWLETNIRRGYKYQDQIKSHFGVDVDYKTLDMPEFIGGVSAPVFSSQVNQTTETETDPLGSYAGQLSLMTNSKHSVKHYCDEHGFIIGIFSVTPVPNYSQLLPKHFLKSNYLDYYFPEFGHIGMQPIDYREVCPIQAYSDNPNNLSKTFGYQRPWYDYIASVDEVHGLFRTNLRNFVLNRTFESLPKLNSDFLQVDADQLNDIFTVQDLEDKIIGQIYFDVTAKRPIPKYGIPRLE